MAKEKKNATAETAAVADVIDTASETFATNDVVSAGIEGDAPEADAVVESAPADAVTATGDVADAGAVLESDIGAESAEAEPVIEAEPVVETDVTALPEPEPFDLDVVEIPRHAELLELTQYTGTVIGSGSFHGAKAKSLLNDVVDGKLDYVVISSSINNGFDRAVLVSCSLFEALNGMEPFSVIAQPISWAVNAPSFSRDSLFAGRTAHAVTEASVGRAASASALVHGTTKVFGYVVSAGDFHDSFAV
jgi:hypothetical protein